MNIIKKHKKMKNKILRIMMIGFLSLSLPVVMGQVATSLYFMDNLPQSSILNPAFDPNYSFYFGLPVVNNTNISLTSDIGLEEVYKNGEFFWNSEAAFNSFVNELPKTSYLAMEFNASVFNLGFATGDAGYLHFSFTNRFDMTIGIPQDFFRLNDLTIGHDLSGFELQARLYNEYAIGYSHAINDKLVLGAKVKFLAGLANGSITFDQLQLNTNADEWEVKVAGSADFSGPVDFDTDENGFPEGYDLTLDESNPTELLDYAIKSYTNPGLGVDLGIEYQVIPRLKLSASIIDLGKINWRREVTNINMEGEYAFGGFSDLITTDGDGIVGIDEDAMDQLQDTIKSSLSATETSNEFSNTLFPKAFVGLEYELTQSLSVGALYKARFIREEVRQNIYFNANANLKHFLTLGANYNYGIDSQSSYGGVIGFRLSPFYIYFAADVLPGYAADGSKFVDGNGESLELPVSAPADLSAMNFQFGVNLVLGERRRALAKKAKKAVPTLFDEDTENSSLNYPF